MLRRESEALHARVRRFAATGSDSEPFDTLALDIARFQAKHSDGYGRLVAARGTSFESVADLPAVPADAFRMSRVAVHAAGQDEACFTTSGTTGAATGRHPMRTLSTYRELSLGFGRMGLAPTRGPRTVVALAEWTPSSSLARMMEFFMVAFDGRSLDAGEFDARSAERWLVRSSEIDRPGLHRAADLAASRSEPLLLLATSFALVALTDELGDATLPLPEGSVVMQTGGFKGRTREVEPSQLRARVALALDLSERRVVGEYGMTELTSQLYEGTLPESPLEGPPGVYLAPPWLRVEPVDPLTLEPVGAGEEGIARFVDLGNVDSALVVVTQDRIRKSGGGIELLGRRPGAPARGCSLAVEQMLLA